MSDHKNLKCLPECQRVQYVDERGEVIARFEEMRMVKHAEGCPRLAASIKRGMELAERFGWK